MSCLPRDPRPLHGRPAGPTRRRRATPRRKRGVGPPPAAREPPAGRAGPADPQEDGSEAARGTAGGPGSRRRPGDRGQSGYVLVFVSVMGLLLMALWAVSWQAMQDAIAVERLHLERQQRDVRLTRALARGLHLLESGEPPADPYACILVVTDEDGVPRPCTLTYRSVAPPETWDVSATPSTDEELSTLPQAPPGFG